MTSAERCIVLGCASCDLVLSLPVTSDDHLRSLLAEFFDSHADHRTWIDVATAGVTLPQQRRPQDDLERQD